ncbi:MAG: acyl--CoA ligase [Pararhodobacter sp.]|nr:acyl--CoA ligase [Pararhodobacter sp.]
MSREPAIIHRVLYGDRLVRCYADCPENLDRMLFQMADLRGAAPAVADDRRTLSYADLQERLAGLAGGLAGQGVGPGARVAVFAGNGVDFVVSLFAIWRLGGIAVPIGTRQTAAELTYMLNHCGATAVLFDAALAPQLPEPEAIPTVRLFAAIDDGTGPLPAEAPPDTMTLDALCGARPGLISTPATDAQDVACIMYTSGTTGRPKGAMLPHLAFYHTARNYELRFGYRSDDRMLLVIPGTHISGLLAAIMTMMQVGGCVVCRRHFRAADVLDTIEAEAITAAIMVPAMYNLLLLEPDIAAHDLTAWRVGHFGGAPMAEVTIRRLSEVLPGLSLYNGFGSTETTSAVTLTTALMAEDALDTVGSILPCVDIRAMDPDGHEVPAGEAGELWIQGPGNAIGYWDNPDATRTGFVGGYWRSGDIGSVDAQGHVRVFDRIKDMINRGGYKVFCVELENVIQAFPGVVEVAAVASPCPVLGERVHVFIHAHQPVDRDALRTYCGTQLADYKVPDFITQLPDPLPRNLNGKLSKAPLREAAQAEAATRRSTHKRSKET